MVDIKDGKDDIECNTKKLKYKRIMLKISGEALAGGDRFGIDPVLIAKVAGEIKECYDLGCEIGIMCGGGNFWRGAKNNGLTMERSRADHMGMLATVMNSIALSETLNNIGVQNRVMSSVPMSLIAETYNISSALSHLKRDRVIIFGGGTGCPYFTTDTGVALKGIEIHADIVLLAKNVDAVYSKDPKKYPDAIKYDTISYEKMIADNLGVTDITALTLLKEHNVPTQIFSFGNGGNIVKCVLGERIGTTVRNEASE